MRLLSVLPTKIDGWQVIIPMIVMLGRRCRTRKPCLGNWPAHQRDWTRSRLQNNVVLLVIVLCLWLLLYLSNRFLLWLFILSIFAQVYLWSSRLPSSSSELSKWPPCYACSQLAMWTITRTKITHISATGYSTQISFFFALIIRRTVL